MERPPLTLLLASVVSASLDGDPRLLLGHLHPRSGPAPAEPHGQGGLATVSTLPRVIPMPRRHHESIDDASRPDPDFDPTAA